MVAALAVTPLACLFTPLDYSGTGGMGAAGAGGVITSAAGAGAGGVCAKEACPPGDPKDCLRSACIDDACGFEPELSGKECGNKLECDADGHCVCTALTAENCPSDECNASACEEGKCEKNPLVGAECKDVSGADGTCSGSGVCGSCNDGMLNGAEKDVDCGVEACGKCNGETCGSGSECHSTNCVDGFCCNVACGGKCEACDGELTVSGQDGSCAPIKTNENDPSFSDCDAKGGCGIDNQCACEDGALTQGETDIDCGGSCVVGKKGKCTAGKKCDDDEGNCDGGEHCVDGVCCSKLCDGPCSSCNQEGHEGLCTTIDLPGVGKCDPMETCNSVAECALANTKSCDPLFPYQCASWFCNANSECAPCTNNAQCPIIGNLCNADGFCVFSSLAKGSSCMDNTQCASGFCVDGICCENACDGTCMACNRFYTVDAPSQDGVCRPILKHYDPHEECVGPGEKSWCSGAGPDRNGNSSCGPPP